MLLLLEGIRFPAVTPKERWSIFAMNRLASLKMGSEIRFKRDQYLSILEFGRRQLKTVNARLLQFCNDNPELAQSLKLLCTIPGIGSVVSVYLLARIGDPGLLRNSREIAHLREWSLLSTPRETRSEEDP
jgi:hypothetical protein